MNKCDCGKYGTTIPTASAESGVLDLKNRKQINKCDETSKCGCENSIEVKFEDNSEDFEISLFDTSNVLIQKSQVVLRATTERWNERPDLVSKKDVFYVYTDWLPIGEKDGVITYSQGLKIGDGKAYLIDLPFIGDIGVTITSEDIDRWDNKWRGYMDSEDFENLVFTTD